ncbi:MAG: Zn-ribbon domain-containing OB-fold protein [Deltaproteobacteria bacterium]|nr:Zn-ribbon domain-containing OB-fold protein [Deltaproteobacteria bacterium]
MATKDRHPDPLPQSPSSVEVRTGAGANKPIPAPTLETAPYWEGCRQHQLRIQRCSNCHQYQFFPRIYCSKCFNEQVAWVNASGLAKVLSFTIVRRPVSPAFANEVPYVVALVTLEEGPQMMTNIVGCAPEEVTIGMPVEVIFEDWSDTIAIPKFRPHR